MKSIITYLFITLFFLITGGRYTVFKIQQKVIQKEIKMQIKNGVPENELINILVTRENRKELNWKHDHEFELKGIFYDVVQKEKIKNGIVYRCVTDEQETVLFTNLQSEVNKELQKNGNLKNSLHSFEYTSTKPISPVTININSLLRRNYWSISQDKFYEQPDYNVIIPPPELYYS